MNCDREEGSLKTANFSRAAVTGKMLSHYDVISKIVQHLKGANLRFHTILDFYKWKRQKKTSYVPDVRVSLRSNRTNKKDLSFFSQLVLVLMN